MFADLHLHSNFSDGTYTPEEVAGNASQHGLGVIALTDHDTVEGCARTKAACEQLSIEFIPAAELTAEHDNAELHILGYFLDTSNQELLVQLERFQEVRQERIREIVRRLNACKVNLHADKVFAIANCKAPGRPHVGRALVEAGICRTVDEAFERFLKRNRPAWVPKFKMSAVSAIELIHSSGGLAVIAHPGISNVDSIIPELVDAGLDGIECFHTKHSTSLSEHYLTLADQYGLVATGGSDCHGMTKGKPLIGSLKLPYAFIERLKQKSRESKRSPGNAPLTPQPPV